MPPRQMRRPWWRQQGGEVTQDLVLESPLCDDKGVGVKATEQEV